MANLLTFENIIVAIVFVLYMMVGISYAIRHQWAWASVWFSYAAANAALIAVAITSKIN